jgi:hypothetical protein
VRAAAWTAFLACTRASSLCVWAKENVLASSTNTRVTKCVRMVKIPVNDEKMIDEN